MSLKHGAVSDPTGVTITGGLTHEKRTTEEDISIEAFDNDGSFEDGKSIRKKTTHQTTGEGLSTLALPTHGTGAGTAASPHIDRVEETEKSEGVADFSVEDHYWEAGEGDFAAPA